MKRIINIYIIKNKINFYAHICVKKLFFFSSHSFLCGYFRHHNFSYPINSLLKLFNRIRNVFIKSIEILLYRSHISFKSNNINLVIKNFYCFCPAGSINLFFSVRFFIAPSNLSKNILNISCRV
jgi:hypothetical protein